MADPLVIDVAGLQLSNNTFSASPPGSLQTADECVIPQKGVAEPRRGQDRAYTMPSASELPFAVTEFQGAPIISFATSKDSSSYGLGVAANPTTSFSGEPFNPVDSSSTSAARMKFGFAGSYLHFCTTTGPKVLEDTSGDPRAAGLLRMPDITAWALSPGNNPDNNWLPYGSSVAYRTVLRMPTSDGTSLLSPPSGRAVVTHRIYAPPGAMVRTGGTLVTVTLANTPVSPLLIDDTFELDPGEADFPPSATETVTGFTPGTTLTYNDAGADVSNDVGQDLVVGPTTVGLTIYLSPDATEDTPVRIYRSRSTSSGNTNPSDEMFLVAELFPSAFNISSGYIEYEDVTPDSVISDPLYTNPLTGEGALETNFAPPLYRDVASWGERLWYSGTTRPASLQVQMLGVGSPDGVQDDDTITIGSLTLTFKDVAVLATDIPIFNDGTPSDNILKTAQATALVASSRLSAAGTPLRCYYVSAQDQAPGKLLLEATDLETTFSFSSSRPETWAPSEGSSSDDRQPNALAYSKLGQPEAVPAINYLPVGSKNYPIRRILGLQQALLVFKAGDGIYTVTGGAPFNVQQISTANIIAPDCACVMADNAWVYTDQGILRISDSGGSSVVSRQIETELNALRDELPEETHDYSFAVPYETERRILFFVPFEVDQDTDLPVLKAWCYNNATQSWSGPLYTNAFSGYVSPAGNKLLLGIYDEAWSTSRVTLERKGSVPAYLDYADADFSATISAIDVGGDPLVITLASVNDVEAGDGIVQGEWRTKVASVDGNNVTLYEEVPFTAASCTVFKGYRWTTQFLPSGNPVSRKTLTRLTWLFKPECFEAYTAQALLLTDAIQAQLEVDMPSTGFGLGPFGEGPFGNPTPMAYDVNPLDAKWTNAAQFFAGVTCREAWPLVKLQGFGARIETAEAPASRGK